MRIKPLADTDCFRCLNCQTIPSKDCVTCQGQGEINGKDNMVKFMEYIIDFKLGVRESYNRESDGHS